MVMAHLMFIISLFKVYSFLCHKYYNQLIEDNIATFDRHLEKITEGVEDEYHAKLYQDFNREGHFLILLLTVCYSILSVNKLYNYPIIHIKWQTVLDQ